MGKSVQILVRFVAKSTQWKRLQVQKLSVCYLCLHGQQVQHSVYNNENKHYGASVSNCSIHLWQCQIMKRNGEECLSM